MRIFCSALLSGVDRHNQGGHRRLPGALRDHNGAARPGDEVRQEFSALVPGPEGERRDAVRFRGLTHGDKRPHHNEHTCQ